MSTAVSCRQVSAAYGARTVLDALSFDVAEGEMVALLGPNGAGKSTLMRVLTGLHAPAAGAVELFGRPVQALRAAERARLVGVIPQEIDAPMAFPVEEFVMMGRTAAMSRWGGPTAEDVQAVERAMAYTDVVELRHRPVTELSGGERQRAVVAMVLAQGPRIILMDEATSHLDINHRIEIMQIVERLNREQRVTVLLTSHDLNLAAGFCGRIMLLDHGRIASDGPPAAVLSEERLRAVYHCDIRVQQDPFDGGIAVFPARRLQGGPPGAAARIHVIGGGGSAAELLRRLCVCGYTVTCGVLNERDSDAEVAAALGLEAVLEKPFSPVGPQALARARELTARADALIVCNVPFGPGNVPNLGLAESGLAAGKLVLAIEGIAGRDYTPDRAAEAAAARLAAAGVRWIRPDADVLAELARLRPA